MNRKAKNRFRTTKEWKNFRNDMLMKFDYRCEICGMKHKHGQNIHHHDERNYTDLDNAKFSVLCPSDHQLLERLLRRKVFNIDEYCENLKRIYKESK